MSSDTEPGPGVEPSLRAEPRPRPWPDGVDRLVLDETDSTNAEGLRRSLPRPTWILARRQTAPRGSRGRAWTTQPGNFAATLAIPDPGPPQEASRYAFAAGLALHDALSRLTRRPEAFALKWPNDLLLEGGKLAGILLERDRVLAIGFGVNLASAPPRDEARPGAARPVALASLARVTPEALLDALAPAFAERDAERRAGFEGIRRAWLARAAQLGQTITARTLREAHVGVFETIDDLGRLILRTPEGRLRIPSADVFFEAA